MNPPWQSASAGCQWESSASNPRPKRQMVDDAMGSAIQMSGQTATTPSLTSKEALVDDVARLSAAVLKPRPHPTAKSVWLSELGAAVAARVRDCLHCGSGSAVRALLTQTDTELDIHVRVLRVKADGAAPDGPADLRGWMVLQQTVREKIAADGALMDLPAPCFESTERPAAQAIEFCQCSPEELPKQLERAGVTTVEDGRRTVCFVVVVGPPTEPIRTHMEAAKSSSFVVSMVPPVDSEDEGDAGEQGDGEDEGKTKGTAGGAPPGLNKLEQLKWRKQHSSTTSGEPWVSLGYDDSVLDPRSSEPARLQLWPRTKDDAAAVALAATMTFRLCPSTPGGVICDAWHVHAAPELTSKRVKAPGAGATIQAHEFLRGQAGRRWLHLRDGSGWVLEGLRSAAGKPRGGGWRQIE